MGEAHRVNCGMGIPAHLGPQKRSLRAAASVKFDVGRDAHAKVKPTRRT